MTTTAQAYHANRRVLVLSGLFMLALYLVIPQLGSLHDSWHLLRHPELAWLGCAFALTASTYLFAAGTYHFLATKRLRYDQLVLVQLAAMFVNRLLPSGLGAISVYYRYLRHTGQRAAQAASLVATNNFLGVIGHLIVLSLSLVIFRGEVTTNHFWHNWSLLRLGEVALGLALGLLILDIIIGQRRFMRLFRDLAQQLSQLGARPKSLAAALTTSIGLTLANVLCLAACGRCLGVHLPFVVSLVVFSFGQGAAAATPTPGGLGGFEAGMLTGLVSYHVALSTALAVVLAYRLVSYWLPLIAGGAAFIVTQRAGLLNA